MATTTKERGPARQPAPAADAPPPPPFDSFPEVSNRLRRLCELRQERDRLDEAFRRTCAELYPPVRPAPERDAEGMKAAECSRVFTNSETGELVVQRDVGAKGERIPSRWPTELPEAARRRLDPDIAAVEHQLRRLFVIWAEKYQFRGAGAPLYAVSGLIGTEACAVHRVCSSPALVRWTAGYGPGDEGATEWLLVRVSSPRQPTARNGFVRDDPEQLAAVLSELQDLERLYGPCFLYAAGQDAPRKVNVEADLDDDDEDDDAPIGERVPEDN